MATLLSILVPTVPGREPKLHPLLSQLDQQVGARGDVELLVLRDHRRMTIGEKRNKMLQIASGEYVVFVDDDDAVAVDYVEAICNALASRPDVLCFNVAVRGHGPEKLCRYHPSFQHANLPHEYRRQPNHLMVWRREIARKVPFPTIRVGEDTIWAKSMSALAHQVETLARTLYVYQFDPADNSQTPR